MGMTQKHVPISAYAVLLILGMSTAWADSHRELLPPPKCCCDQAACSTASCCSTTESCAACCKESALERRLRALCSVDFKETTLEDAIERFREWSGVNIVVDEPALADAGVSLQRTVSLKLDGLPLKRAFEVLLHQVRLTCVVEKDLVLLTTEARATG